MASSQRTRSPLALVVAAAASMAVAIGAVSGLDPRLGILFAVGVTFAAVVFADLLIGFAVMVLFAFLEVLSVLGGVSLAKLAGVLLVVAWLAVVTTRGARTRDFFADHAGLTYLLLAFVGWNAISLAWSESSSDGMASVMRYALNVALLPIAYTAVRDRRDVMRVFGVVVVGATVAAISGILAAPSPSDTDFSRAAGTVGDPNELAAALLVGLALAAAFVVNRGVAPVWRVLSAVSAALCLLGIVLTLSRGGLLGVTASAAMAVIVGGRWRGRVLTGSVVLLLLAAGYFAFFASPPAKERVLNVGGGTGRLDLWTVGSRMVEAHPLVGVGTGQFQVSSIHYLLQPGAIQRGDFILSTPKVAHNTYLEVIAEGGLVGGLLFGAIAAFCFGCACVAVARLRRDGDERLEILARGFVAGLGGYFVTILFISENYSKLLWILLALGPVLLAVTSGAAREREATP